jgi:hypothetical protein
VAAAIVALSTGSMALLDKALDPNPSLKNYTASVRMEVEVHSFIPARKTFTGTAFYTRPEQRVVFDNATGPLSRFREMTTNLPTKSDLLANYRVTTGGDDGTSTQFLAERIAPDARVRTITLSVDDKSGLLTDVLWSYSDGSTLNIMPHYERVRTYQLHTRDDVRARFKGYSADATLTLSDFRF